MNQELEKLLEITLTDGYLSDKERRVLQTKGERMGMSADEVDVIIDARLYELNKEKTEKDIREKCPNCGEVLIGISLVCRSCEYVITEPEDKSKSSVYKLLEDLEYEVNKISTPPDVKLGVLIKRWYLIFFSLGIYIIYKKLIRRKRIFDRYEDFHNKIVERTDMLKSLIVSNYGANPDIRAQANRTIAVRDEVISKRRRSGIINSFISFVVSFAIIITVLNYLSKRQLGPDGKAIVYVTTDSVKGVINAGQPAKALMLYNKLDEYAKEPLLLEQIKKSEIDSLTKQGNYNLALEKANLLKEDYRNDDVDREKVVDAIIEKEVLELIQDKKFERARERSEMASISPKRRLEEKIDLAEKLYKEQQPKPTKRKRR